MGDYWEDKVLYLAEMFPSLSIDVLENMVKESLPLEKLVDKCLSLEKKEPSTEEDGSAYSMVSLIPRSTDEVSSTPSKKSSEVEEKYLSEKQISEAVSDLGIEQLKIILSDDTEALKPLILALRTMAKFLENITTNPDIEKYRKLSLPNPKLESKISILQDAIGFLKKLGFEENVTPSGTITDKRKLIYSKTDLSALRTAASILRGELRTLEGGKKEEETKETPAPLPTGKINDDIYLSKRQWGGKKRPPQEEERTRRRSKAEMAQIAEKRLRGEKVTDGKVTRGRVGDFNRMKQVREEIKEMRSAKHSKWRNTTSGRKRVFTVSDLEKLRAEDKETTAKFGSGSMGSSSFTDLTAIGKEALRLTNEFRAQNKLPPLSWHQTLAEIGYVHSKNMGDGKAKFSHDGFHDRVAKYTFPSRSAAENLAMNHGLENVAKVAVDGWIDSPGHRKNLLSHHNYCGIGVYRNSSGAFYLTQLFGLG